jgi:hypothetical protein
MTTNEDDIICHNQIIQYDRISVNLTEIEPFLVALASILDRILMNIQLHRSQFLRGPKSIN